MYTAVPTRLAARKPQLIQEAYIPIGSRMAEFRQHSSRARGNGAAGGVPLHVRIVIVISIALLVMNASLLVINTAATMDSMLNTRARMRSSGR